jgi:hypothetical protein
MKRLAIILLSFLFFVVSKAQVITFVSLGNTTLKKEANGSFAEAKTWRIQQMEISVNLDQKRIQFFSKGILDSDSFSLKKEISLVEELEFPNGDDQMIKGFSGIDDEGRKCMVRFKPFNYEKMLHRELQIEYRDLAEIYRLNRLGEDPTKLN